MRFQCTGLLFIATATLVLSAPTAQADTQYGGTGLYKGNRPAAPSISLLRRDNGQIAARVLLSASCRGWANHNMVIRVTGSTPDGASFTASGKSKLSKKYKNKKATIGFAYKSGPIKAFTLYGSGKL